MTLECVVNVSEGRDLELLGALAAACDDVLLDVHRDPDHHRSVFTLGGPAPAVEQAARSLTATTVARLDLAGHDGRHPRIGVVDVVPFVPLPLVRRTSCVPPTSWPRRSPLATASPNGRGRRCRSRASSTGR